MNLFKNRTVVGVFCILLSLLICWRLEKYPASAVHSAWTPAHAPIS